MNGNAVNSDVGVVGGNVMAAYLMDVHENHGDLVGGFINAYAKNIAFTGDKAIGICKDSKNPIEHDIKDNPTTG